jgi:hypothetical protein
MEDDEKQDREWEALHARLQRCLSAWGTEDPFGHGDYLIVDDNYGYRRHTVEVHQLHMLRPEIVKQVHGILREFPGWEVVISVDVPGTEHTWPRMGLTLDPSKIVDNLRREYLPKEAQNYRYGA